jgi:hypothetical protein
VFTASGDGVAWGPVTRIPIDPVGSGVDHFIPGFTIQPQGTIRSTTPRLALGYYYYPVSNCGGACQLNVGFVFSANGGGAWSAPAHLAGPMQLSWLANTNQGRMVGDYMGTAYSGNNAFPVYADATAPVGSLFKEAMFTTQEAASSQVGTFTRASSVGAHHFLWARSHPPKTAN